MPRSRLLYIDGLRGMAAMAVVFYHLKGAVDQSAGAWISAWLDSIFGFGYLGVDVFFVISGFVIPLSVLDKQHTVRFLGRFALRRSLRLDPPYWAAIALELLALKLGLLLFPGTASEFWPSLEQLIAHLFYVQDLLGYGGIVVIFWTLCYEVQFYLAFVSGLVAIRRISAHLPQQTLRSLVAVSLGSSFLVSILMFSQVLDRPLDGLFLDRWHQFLMGYLALRCFQRAHLEPAFVTATILLLIISTLGDGSALENSLAVVATSWLIVAAALWRQLGEKLTSLSLLQFLGRISYSLYLIHPIVGWRFVKLLREVWGTEFNALEAWAAFSLGVTLSIVSAWIIWRLVEAPSIFLAHRAPLDAPVRLANLLRRPVGRT